METNKISTSEYYELLKTSQSLKENINLVGADLTKIKFTDKNFGSGGLDLSRVNLSGLDLSEFSHSGNILNEANLDNCDLYLSYFPNIQLQNASLKNCDLRKAHLTYANLEGADLTGSDLSYCDLSNANLTGANLSYHSNTPAGSGNLLTSSVVSPTIPTTYYVLATNDTCTNELAVTVNVATQPNISTTSAVSISLIFNAWYNCLASDNGVRKSELPTITKVGVSMFPTKEIGE